MSLPEVMQELRRRGVRLFADGGSVRYVGERKALDPELIRELARSKGAVLAALKSELDPAVPEPEQWDLARERFEERAAILEFDAGFTREEAERLAAAALGPVEAAP